MPKQESAPETRLSAVLIVLRKAFLLGALAAVLGAGVGYFSSETTWAGALRGMNWASLALAAYAGMIVVGRSQIRQVDRSVNLQYTMTQVSPSGDAYPWATLLTASLASVVCACVWFLLNLWK